MHKILLDEQPRDLYISLSDAKEKQRGVEELLSDIRNGVVEATQQQQAAISAVVQTKDIAQMRRTVGQELANQYTACNQANENGAESLAAQLRIAIEHLECCDQSLLEAEQDPKARLARIAINITVDGAPVQINCFALCTDITSSTHDKLYKLIWLKVR